MINYYNYQKEIITAISMSTFLFIGISLSIICYLIIFIKRKFKKCFINKKILIILFSILGINFTIIIFGFLLNFIINLSSIIPLIIIIIFSFILNIGVGIYIFLFLQIIAIKIDEKEIIFLGEKILIHKISSVECNNKTNQLVIYYTEGTRYKKKCRFSLLSKAGKFIISNIDLLNQEIIKSISN